MSHRDTQRAEHLANLARYSILEGEAEHARAWATQAASAARRVQRARAQRLNRQAREDAYRSAGMVPVRGALGGRYWE